MAIAHDSSSVCTPLVEDRQQSPRGGWAECLPTLSGAQVVLRQLRLSDTVSLSSLLGTPEVRRYIYEPPASPEGFERFISWMHREQAEGRSASFAVTLKGFDTAIGLFQVRATEADFAVADWGFILGSPFWGTGVFQESAELILEFIFGTLGVQRLDAIAATKNGRANGVLARLGAVQQELRRRSFLCQGEYLDETLYAMFADDYRDYRASRRPGVSAGRVLVH